MASNPIKENNNIYFHCRKQAALYNDKLYSRESASELLGVSVSSLADYELGNTKVVPVDKVVLMGDLYNAPELLNYYCSKECPIGCRKDIPVEISSLEQITLKILDDLQSDKLSDCLKLLIRIAKDGKINENEKDDMKKVAKYLKELKHNIDELILFDDKRRGAEK